MLIIIKFIYFVLILYLRIRFKIILHAWQNTTKTDLAKIYLKICTKMLLLEIYLICELCGERLHRLKKKNVRQSFRLCLVDRKTLLELEKCLIYCCCLIATFHFFDI